jgi:hypothetical protein
MMDNRHDKWRDMLWARKGGREAGRQGGREAGRQGGREAGRQGGREEGRREVYLLVVALTGRNYGRDYYPCL